MTTRLASAIVYLKADGKALSTEDMADFLDALATPIHTDTQEEPLARGDPAIRS